MGGMNGARRESLVQETIALNLSTVGLLSPSPASCAEKQKLTSTLRPTEAGYADSCAEIHQSAINTPTHEGARSSRCAEPAVGAESIDAEGRATEDSHGEGRATEDAHTEGGTPSLESEVCAVVDVTKSCLLPTEVPNRTPTSAGEGLGSALSVSGPDVGLQTFWNGLLAKPSTAPTTPASTAASGFVTPIPARREQPPVGSVEEEDVAGGMDEMDLAAALGLSVSHEPNDANAAEQTTAGPASGLLSQTTTTQQGFDPAKEECPGTAAPSSEPANVSVLQATATLGEMRKKREATALEVQRTRQRLQVRDWENEGVFVSSLPFSRACTLHG